MLGAGGMGVVYQVRHLISDRIEAVKVLLPDLASSPELGDRFVREIRVQASLNHPNIAALHNALRLDNQLLMVMEFVDGQTLAEITRRGPLNQLQAIDVGTQVLAALDYAHAHSVIHRDVKPSNIIVTSQGVVKLMDFGIARRTAEFGMLTRAGAAIGSMYYMSPEQIKGENVDARSDVYATGVTLYEALTRQRPVTGDAVADVMQAHLQQQPVAPRVLNPSVSEDLSSALMKSLAKDPAQRYQTANAFREELLRVKAGISNPGMTEPLTALTRVRERTPAPPSATGSRSSGSGTINFDPLGLERVRKDLAQHIGPMAKVLVDRAARRARNWQELYATLAAEIPAGKERERFLAQCPRSS